MQQLPDSYNPTTLLYSSLTRFGKLYQLNMAKSPEDFLREIEPFRNDWKQYNPRKPIARYGLSITSLDGGLSGRPDLDSLMEYTRETGIKVSELDIKIPTPIFEFAQPWMGPMTPWIVRSHVIRMEHGAFFPVHRDNRGMNIRSFRLFVPLKNCNPPNMYFILDGKLITFEPGRVYFMDTCLEHTLFTTGFASWFIVFNVEITVESVQTLTTHCLAIQ